MRERVQLFTEVEEEEPRRHSNDSVQDIALAPFSNFSFLETSWYRFTR